MGSRILVLGSTVRDANDGFLPRHSTVVMSWAHEVPGCVQMREVFRRRSADLRQYAADIRLRHAVVVLDDAHRRSISIIRQIESCRPIAVAVQGANRREEFGVDGARDLRSVARQPTGRYAAEGTGPQPYFAHVDGIGHRDILDRQNATNTDRTKQNSFHRRPSDLIVTNASLIKRTVE